MLWLAHLDIRLLPHSRSLSLRCARESATRSTTMTMTMMTMTMMRTVTMSTNGHYHHLRYHPIKP